MMHVDDSPLLPEGEISDVAPGEVRGEAQSDSASVAPRWQERDAWTALAALDESPALVPVRDWPAGLTCLDRPGLYAWWVDEAGAADLSRARARPDGRAGTHLRRPGRSHEVALRQGRRRHPAHAHRRDAPRRQGPHVAPSAGRSPRCCSISSTSRCRPRCSSRRRPSRRSPSGCASISPSPSTRTTTATASPASSTRCWRSSTRRSTWAHLPLTPVRERLTELRRQISREA